MFIVHKFINIINNTYERIIDALLPKRCLGCRKFDTWLCDVCHNTLPLLTEQKCYKCKKIITNHGEICFNCMKNDIYYLDGIFVVSDFKNELLKDVIYTYKYKFIKELSDPLGLLIVQSIINNDLKIQKNIIPVPLHPRRYRWRGFNQATLLAKSLDIRDSEILENVLIRVKYTKSQVKLKNKFQRIENIKNAFKVKNKDKIKNKEIVLIDDITTTTSTLTECAKSLKKSGAKKVYAIVLARE